MNTILIATLIVTAIFGVGVYSASQVFDTSVQSTASSDIDILKKSEQIHGVYNVTANNIILENVGGDTSEIVMFRFYDDDGQEIHRVIFDEDTDREFMDAQQQQVIPIPASEGVLEKRMPKSYSLSQLGVPASLEDISVEAVTKFGNVISLDIGKNTIDVMEELSSSDLDGDNDYVAILDDSTGEIKKIKAGSFGGTGFGDDAGGGSQAMVGLGISLAIQNIDNNGKVYYGQRIIGQTTDVRPYVDVGPDDIWAAAIAPDEPHKMIISVPEFGKQYRYDSQSESLIDISDYGSNDLNYSESRILTGDVTVSRSEEGLKFTGDGEIVLKLNDYSDKDMILRGHGTADNILKIVTSEVDLINDEYFPDRGYLSYNENVDPGVNTIAVEAGIDSTHTGIMSYSFSSITDRAMSHGCYPVGHIDSFGFNVSAQNRPWITNDYNGHRFCQYYGSWSPTTQLVKTNNGDSYTITGDRYRPQVLTDILRSYNALQYTGYPLKEQRTSNYNFKIYDTLPSLEKAGFKDGDYEGQLTFPIGEQTYLYVKLDGGSSVIRGEILDSDSDLFLKATNLPEHTAFDLGRDGIIWAAGKTDGAGTILLRFVDTDFDTHELTNGILKIYPGAALYTGDLGTALLDMYNKGSIKLDSAGDGQVYIPQSYVRWVFPVAVEIADIRIDDLPLDYLNGNYAKNEVLLIPVIPSAQKIYATVNGVSAETLMRDISATTQINRILQKSATSSDEVTAIRIPNYIPHNIEKFANAATSVTTSSFIAATHDGTAVANIDIKAGGDADYIISAKYDDVDRTEKPKCRNGWVKSFWHDVYIRCSHGGGRYTISNAYAIGIMNDNAKNQCESLLQKLQQGSNSDLTVKIDVYKNGDKIDTYIIQEFDTSDANISHDGFEPVTVTALGYRHTPIPGSVSVCDIHVTYPLISMSEIITVPVSVGDLVHFVISADVTAAALENPKSEGGIHTSHVVATAELGNGAVTVAMS